MKCKGHRTSVILADKVEKGSLAVKVYALEYPKCQADTGKTEQNVVQLAELGYKMRTSFHKQDTGLGSAWKYSPN